MYTNEPEPGFYEKNSILIKGLLVGFLILIMLIPGVFVSNLVSERQARQEAVVNDVSNKWAGKQTVTGPMLLLPYKTDAGTVKMAYVLPNDLRISGNINPIKKKRSLYNVMLYTSNLQLDGRFDIPFEKLQLNRADVLWGNARLVLAVGDLHGITEQVALNWNGTKQFMEAGVPENKQVSEGLSTPIVMNEDGTATFSINLSIKGSEYLYFTPLGKSTDVNISAAWKDPKFDGQYLPDTSVIGKDHFTAHWKILPLSHNYPQSWKDNVYALEKAAFGVSLIQPVDEYSKTNRSVKYAILFIALTFTFFFFLEILLKKKIHAIQYLLVGMALTIFYTLLLSISEYAGFNVAYLIASIATVMLISMYVWSIFKNTKTAIGFTCTLAGLYGYIFILIQSEDYALLFGSIGLFLILAVIMYYSRKIEWYAPARVKAEVPRNDYKVNIKDDNNESRDEENNEQIQ
ncbi:cell envelope integrity protein CreD [Flavipsychrobacter stenotrophus]|uniref:Cell envelope integrity protein CreD n=1 Tax=Flavipsychrobacter stenotrophus TaxID=2077091 RepID=A0A2S7SQZ4_9BACT|nr:cell envelope integrity protein CreD [Flavipsychrobacter stenotrophus]PQJ09329.1 cell envelope integrity protein CreD [Flavipsychrobacter stenotrophus]